MSISRLPSGRWRAQVHDTNTGRNVSVSKVLPDEPGTYRTKTEAKQARERARAHLAAPRKTSLTVGEWHHRWTHDKLYERPKVSTNIHYAERTRAFAERYAALELADIADWGDRVAAEWIAGGRNVATVGSLRVMFNDAMSAKAGRLCPCNPFAGLGLSKGPGNKHKQPPDQLTMQNMVRIAWDITPPSFAGYLEFGCLTAIRPGELDALTPDAIDLAAGDIHVTRQWNVKARQFTPPKYGPYTCALIDDARTVLDRLPRTAGGKREFVFETIHGTHYTPSSRTHHWNRVRAAAGMADLTLYLATRHYFGWYAVNVLELDPAVVAEQLGHKDGGKLVEQLYGHPDKARRREIIRQAARAHGKVTPLRTRREDTA